jgi:hypothetical protein
MLKWPQPAISTDIIVFHVCRKSEGKIPLERPSRRWENETNLNEIGREGLNCIRLIQDRVYWRDNVHTPVNFRGGITHLEDLGVDVRMVLNLILKKQCMGSTNLIQCSVQ